MRVLMRVLKNILNQIIVKQALFALLILTLCRFIWFFSNLFWLPNNGGTAYMRAFFAGIYFDLPVLAYFFSPVWLWLIAYPNGTTRFPKISRSLFTLSAFACILLNSIDTAYSRVTAKRTGFELFNMLEDKGNKVAPYVKDYIPGILGIVLFTYLVFRFVPLRGYSLYMYKRDRKWLPLVIMPVVAGTWLLLARGGTRLKPLRSIDAGLYASPGLAPLTVSTPLQLMSTLGQKPFPSFDFMPEKEAMHLLGLEYVKGSRGQSNKKNVCLIIVESLGRDYTGFLNNQPFTPFLDSLSRESINFRFCFANGTRSIEMVPSVFCGLPSLMDEAYINSIYASNKLNNIFMVFEQMGYGTAFFHGGANGTMGFQAFLEHSGLRNYYGQNEYPNSAKDQDGSWGIYDEPYLQYYANCLDTMHKPFFTAVFTLSSHHPYTIPKQYEGKLPKGPLPIHRSIAYTDLALRKFFSRARRSPWFANTVFVITGDHTSYGTKDYFYSQTGHYEIPLLIYGENIKPQTIDKSISQCDISPTILDLLKLQPNWFSLGRSAFDSTYSGYSIHYDGGLYYIAQYPYVVGIDGSGQVKDYSIRLRNEPKARFLPVNEERCQKMKRLLEAYLQVYSERIRNNHWY